MTRDRCPRGCCIGAWPLPRCVVSRSASADRAGARRPRHTRRRARRPAIPICRGCGAPGTWRSTTSRITAPSPVFPRDAASSWTRRRQDSVPARGAREAQEELRGNQGSRSLQELGSAGEVLPARHSAPDLSGWPFQIIQTRRTSHFNYEWSHKKRHRPGRRTWPAAVAGGRQTELERHAPRPIRGNSLVVNLTNFNALHLVRHGGQLPQRRAEGGRALHPDRSRHAAVRGDDGGSEGVHPPVDDPHGAPAPEGHRPSSTTSAPRCWMSWAFITRGRETSMSSDQALHERHARLDGSVVLRRSRCSWSGWPSRLRRPPPRVAAAGRRGGGAARATPALPPAGPIPRTRRRQAGPDRQLERMGVGLTHTVILEEHPGASGFRRGRA